MTYGRRFKSGHQLQLALAKKMQAKIPHFGAGFLRLKQENQLSLQQLASICKIRRRKIKITLRR